jgi:hypothetical protein
MGQPFRERNVLIVAALEHLQEDQVCIPHVLDVMQQRFFHVPDNRSDPGLASPDPTSLSERRSTALDDCLCSDKHADRHFFRSIDIPVVNVTWQYTGLPADQLFKRSRFRTSRRTFSILVSSEK